jgi:hypothetical protein
MKIDQVFENLFELIHQYLECHEVVALLSASKSVRTLLIPQETENIRALRNRSAKWDVRITLRYRTVLDWRLCFDWMSKYRFMIESLILDNPEQVVTYFKSLFFGFPLSVMAVRLLYRGGSVPTPLIAIEDNPMLRSELFFLNCSEDCFSSLYESNLSCNLSLEMVEMWNDEISLENICIAIIGANDSSQFSSMQKLECVYFCQGLNTIDDSLLSYTPSLSTVILPEGLTTIGSRTFEGCSGLSMISLPHGLLTLGNDAFNSCTSLSSVVLHEGLSNIGDAAFSNCSSLSSIVLPYGLVSIGSHAFYGCVSLSSIVLPEGLISLGDNAFSGCTSLSSVVFPDTLLAIASEAFRDCTSLSSALLPQGLTSLGAFSFSGCTSLSSVVLPKTGLISIGHGAFSSSIYSNATEDYLFDSSDQTES